MKSGLRLTRPGYAATWVVILAFLFSATVPYVFVGPFPVWILFGLLASVVSISRRMFPRMIYWDNNLFFVACSWVLLIAFTFALDLTAAVPRDVMAGPTLNLLTFLVFVGVLCASVISYDNRIVLAVFLVGLLQGSLGLMQLLGVPGAWDAPNTLSNFFGPLANLESVDLDELGELQRMGRARGTHLFIHIYNGIQSCLMAFCLFLAFSPERRLSLASRIFRLIVAGVAVAGTLSSFSRSGVLAILLVILVLLFYRARIARWTSIGIAGVLGLIALNQIGLFDATAVERLTDFDIGRQTNAARFDHFETALNSVSSNPLFGESADALAAAKRDVPIHSVPLRYMNDYGLLGLFCYFSIIGGLVLYFSSLRKRQNRSVSNWGGVGLSVLSAVVADSWTHSSGFLRRDILHALMLGIVVGLSLQARMRAK